MGNAVHLHWMEGRQKAASMFIEAAISLSFNDIS